MQLVVCTLLMIVLWLFIRNMPAPKP